jgi:hypothetical protein
MTPEQKVIRQIMASLNARRKAGHPLWYFKVHGGPMQKAGVPDLIVVYHGVPFFFEVKAEGGVASALQTETIRQIRRAGGRASVVYSVEDVTTLLGSWYENSRSNT